MIAVCTVAQMRAAESAVVAEGAGQQELMARAGRAIFDVIQARRGPLAGRRSLVLVGPGSNGGDGLIIAGHLAAAGCKVNVLASRPLAALADLAQSHREIRTHTWSPGLAGRLAQGSELVIDALLGIGAQPPLRGPIRQIIAEVAGFGQARIAIDIPSGVDAESGASDPGAFLADLTVTAGPIKYGTVQFPARRWAGMLATTDIGLAEVGSGVVLSHRLIRSLMPERSPDGHKGTFGRVLVVAGSSRYRGAAGLVLVGAQRAGAGYVTLASIEPVVAAVAAQMLGPTFEVLPATDGMLAAEVAGPLSQLADRAQAVIIGPGLGLGNGPRKVVEAICHSQSQAGLVIDADALTLLSPLRGQLGPSAECCVMTPHPGEMARLIGKSPAAVGADRLSSVQQAASISGVVTVLKGAGSIVAHPDGRYAICALDCPALASAGSGDVLSGVIGSLLGQGLCAWDAARLGVYLHARAGQLAGRAFTATAAIAADLPELIAAAIGEIEVSGGDI